MRALDLALAIPFDDLDELKSRLAPTLLEYTGKRARGYQLAAQADRLDAAGTQAALDAVQQERVRLTAELDQRNRDAPRRSRPIASATSSSAPLAQLRGP